MYYSEIKYNDIANGPGVRTSLFVSGCRHHCPECFNKETWTFNHGRIFTEETEKDILKSLDSPYIDGLSILGGEPLEPENQSQVSILLMDIREKFPSKSIWIWTGFTFEDILTHDPNCRAVTPVINDIFRDIDVLVDGLFDENRKDLLLRFRGSSNQRIIDIPKSLKSNQTILWKDSPIFSSHTWE